MFLLCLRGKDIFVPRKYCKQVKKKKKLLLSQWPFTCPMGLLRKGCTLDIKMDGWMVAWMDGQADGMLYE